MNKDLIIQRYKQPKYFSKGIVPNGSSINSNCGDEVFVRTEVVNGKLIKCEYNGSGCSICLATTDLLIDYILNKEIEEVKRIKEEDIFSMIGMDLNSGRKRCATLSIEAVKDALNNVE